MDMENDLERDEAAEATMSALIDVIISAARRLEGAWADESDYETVRQYFGMEENASHDEIKRMARTLADGPSARKNPKTREVVNIEWETTTEGLMKLHEILEVMREAGEKVTHCVKTVMR